MAVVSRPPEMLPAGPVSTPCSSPLDPISSYLTGYDAIALERLTCLVVPRRRASPSWSPRGSRCPPRRRPRSAGSGCPDPRLGRDRRPLRARRLPRAGRRDVALADSMTAAAVLRLRDAMPAAQQQLAGAGPARAADGQGPGRGRPTCGAPASAIDRVHEQVPDFLRPGRTEREVGEDIAEAILAAGHVDGRLRDRRAAARTAPARTTRCPTAGSRSATSVVVDIGGTMPSGYCSDSTRTYAIGHAPDDFLAYYAVLQDAQQRAVDVSAAWGVGRVGRRGRARDVIAEAGYGDSFIHRTGHGIGLETHEEPYIVAGQRRAAAGRAWCSASSRASTCPASTGHGSRTSSSSPRTASSRSTTRLTTSWSSTSRSAPDAPAAPKGAPRMWP